MNRIIGKARHYLDTKALTMIVKKDYVDMEDIREWVDREKNTGHGRGVRF